MQNRRSIRGVAVIVELLLRLRELLVGAVVHLLVGKHPEAAAFALLVRRLRLPGLRGHIPGPGLRQVGHFRVAERPVDSHRAGGFAVVPVNAVQNPRRRGPGVCLCGLLCGARRLGRLCRRGGGFW